MRQARDEIDKGMFDEFRREFVSNYETREVDVV
jgi:queuine/archaeosine tRNA-ribosyltransferase